jgi:hypothetical protein
VRIVGEERRGHRRFQHQGEGGHLGCGERTAPSLGLVHCLAAAELAH